ncbi:MAG: hypothetical protein HYT03_03540 [Candidatus Harrisonbacteria bacterium]|nr:hypothetical protein [Candidatus Harrisonbacteria bacterium]
MKKRKPQRQQKFLETTERFINQLLKKRKLPFAIIGLHRKGNAFYYCLQLKCRRFRLTPEEDAALREVFKKYLCPKKRKNKAH